jgi:hypothetical protein
MVTESPRRDWPRAGDVVFVGYSASMRFGGAKAFNSRIIRVDAAPMYEGWAWLEGYQLGPDGDAVDRRSIFVRCAGLRPASRQVRRRRG